MKVAIYARDIISPQHGYVTTSASNQVSILQKQAQWIGTSTNLIFCDYRKVEDDTRGLHALQDAVDAGKVDIILILCSSVISDSDEEFNQFLDTIHTLDAHVQVRTYCPLSLQAVHP